MTVNKREFDILLENSIAVELVAGVETMEEIADQFGCSHEKVTAVAKRKGLCRKRGNGSPVWRHRKQQEKAGA